MLILYLPYFLLTLLFLIHPTYLQTTSTLATGYNNSPNYYSSSIFFPNPAYYEFVAGTDTADAAFTAATPVYSFTRSLGQTYSNVKYLRAALSTWNSKSQWFGFDTAITYDTDPISEFRFELTILQNNSFIKLGFSVLLIC